MKYTVLILVIRRKDGNDIIDFQRLLDKVSVSYDIGQCVKHINHCGKLYAQLWNELVEVVHDGVWNLKKKNLI